MRVANQNMALSFDLFFTMSGIQKKKGGWEKGDGRRYRVREIFSSFTIDACLVGGFNPSEKYSSKWESSPSRGENKKYLKPPPSC